VPSGRRSVTGRCGPPDFLNPELIEVDRELFDDALLGRASALRDGNGYRENAVFGVGGHDIHRRADSLVAPRSGDKRRRPPEGDGRKEHVACLRKVAYLVILGLVPPHYQLYRVGKAEVAADLEQGGVVHRAAGIEAEQVAEPGGEDRIRKQAAPGRAAELFQLVFPGQPVLPFSGPAGKIEKPLPVDDAFLLGDGRGKMLGGQGPQDQACQAALPFDEGYRLPALGHRSLADHLARDKEARAYLFHERARRPQHEDAAVDAGVHVPTVSVGRRLDHPQVFDAFGLDGHPHAKLVRAAHRLSTAPPGGFLRAVAEGRREMEGGYLDALVLHELRCKDAVESSGQEGDGFSVHDTPIMADARSFPDAFPIILFGRPSPCQGGAHPPEPGRDGLRQNCRTSLDSPEGVLILEIGRVVLKTGPGKTNIKARRRQAPPAGYLKAPRFARRRV